MQARCARENHPSAGPAAASQAGPGPSAEVAQPPTTICRTTVPQVHMPPSNLSSPWEALKPLGHPASPTLKHISLPLRLTRQPCPCIFPAPCMLNFHPAFIFAKNNSKCLKPLTSLHVLKVSICVKSHQRTRHILFQILQNVWRNQTFSCRTTGNGGLGQTHKVMLVTHQERLMLTGEPVPNLQGRDWHGSCLLVSMPLEFGDSFSISLRGPAPRLCPEILTQLSINVTKGCLALSQRDSPETGNLSSSVERSAVP